MDAQTVKEYIDEKIFTNNRRAITASTLNAVLTDMLTLQAQNDAQHDQLIANTAESLTYLEIDNLLNL